MRMQRLRSGTRRRAMLVSLTIGLGAALVLKPTVLAVHDTGAFELDGNAQAGAAPGDDWSDVFSHSSHATATSFNTDNLLNDGPSLQATFFTGGGSKDPIDISSWAWKDGAGGIPDKDNLLHSFAARYSLTPTDPTLPGNTCPNGTGGPNQPTFDPNKPCEVLYFGSDRYDNSGDAQQGFWFFQNAIGLGTTPSGGGFTFTGVHKNGDLLIISDFSNGGTTSIITIYRWDTTCTATNKPTGDCGDANLRRLASSNNANCTTATAADAFCGIVNGADGTPSPWPFLDKSGNSTFLQGEFYEGGVNLSLLGLGGECFATVASESRSSTSTTATLKDFVLGGFAKCETGLTTTPKDSGGNDIPAAGLSIGTGSVDVKDSAAITVGGIANWTGTLQFYLCGPTPLANDYVPCTTTTTPIGSAITVSNSTSQPILSVAATVTSVGKYCWRGVFTSGTSGVPNASDPDPTANPLPTNECFTVNPVTPNAPTAASGDVTLGGSVTDQANLSGTANQPGSPIINPTTAGAKAGGTITFRLYGPGDATCSTTPVYTSSGVTVSGDGFYSTPAPAFVPTVAGTYRWIATYSGNSPNTNGFVGVCGGVAGEDEVVVVNPKQPAISTVATAGPVNLGNNISDTATISGLGTPSNGVQGTITFNAYGPFNAANICTGAAVYTNTVTITGNGSFGSGNFKPTTAGTYNWIASYTPATGDVNNLPVSGACSDANESSVVQQLQPTIATAQTFTLKDTATISISDLGGGNLAGNVRFQLYNNATCATNAPNALLYDSETAHAGGIPLAAGTALSKSVDSDVVTVTVQSPQLSWLVTYTSTNAGHKNVTSTCNTEQAHITWSNQ